MEIGMGFGVSTLAILYALRTIGKGHHVAIDPNQVGTGSATGLGGEYQQIQGRYNSIGLTMVATAQLGEMLEFVGKPSYSALPAMMKSAHSILSLLTGGTHSTTQ